ncbi:MAG: hypothetical protein QM813_22685 [Verrucomicrobiota bacterium]
MPKKIFISAGLLISLVSIVVLLASCMTPTVSHISVPGSSMTMVVTADLAGCYDVELFDHGQPIPGSRRCLGPYASQHVSSQVSTTSNIVTIALSDGGYHYTVAVDVAARQFVTNSVPNR